MAAFQSSADVAAAAAAFPGQGDGDHSATASRGPGRRGGGNASGNSSDFQLDGVASAAASAAADAPAAAARRHSAARSFHSLYASYLSLDVQRVYKAAESQAISHEVLAPAWQMLLCGDGSPTCLLGLATW
jgi:hypothetical protein